MKKICIVTATRSEYGALRWLIDDVKNDSQLVLQLVVTGTHLSPEFGLTYREIESDGYVIDEKVDFLISSATQVGVAKSMGVCTIGFADVFNRLNPDILIVLGDRYELLPICSVALILSIPIVHISGGDITEGAIDNQIRNAVTMMAAIHFPGVVDSARRIESMISKSEYIYAVGEPGLDNFLRLDLLTREGIAESLGLDISKTWILLTYHPETKLPLNENIEAINNILNALDQLEDKYQIIATGANSDFGGYQINEILQKASLNNNSKYKFFISLGQIRYMSLMKAVELIVGNSSSAIIEAPFLGIPVLNIGNRQTGRYLCGNIISTQPDISSIKKALIKSKSITIDSYDSKYYGNGNTSSLILKKIKEYLQY